MKSFFSRNIDKKGRVIRGIMAFVLLLGAWFAYPWSIGLSVMLAIAGLVGVFETARSWCFLRACGIKTKF